MPPLQTQFLGVISHLKNEPFWGLDKRIKFVVFSKSGDNTRKGIQDAVACRPSNVIIIRGFL
jgi:hypothetical protein